MRRAPRIRSARLRGVLGDMKELLRREIGDGFRLILFGSHARNEGKPDSDVDLMVILPDNRYRFEVREQVRDLVYGLSFRSDYLLSVMIVSESMAREHAGFQVFAAIEKEGVPL